MSWTNNLAIAGLGSNRVRALDKQYGKGNWSLTGGPGMFQSGTVQRYAHTKGGMHQAPVYSKPKKEKEKKPKKPPAPPAPAAPPPTQQQPTLPVDNFPSPQQGPSMQDVAGQFASQIAEMQAGFMQSMQQQQQAFQQAQMQQQQRMEAMQQQMMQAQIQQQMQRPEVMGVEAAQSSAGTPMQIARRGATGAFGRKGLRIKNLNV